ncbi:Protease HtpX [bacterium HR40]|nr:Protease HtpX [bacterium HR40]
MGFVRTTLLLAALTGLFVTVGFVLGGEGGALVALALALLTNLFAWWNSDRLALAAHGARPLDPRSAPDLWSLVGELARRAGLPMPRLYLIEAPQPNAFATGRTPERAAVAVTSGLLAALDRRELAAVIAHELAHIRNRDTLTMTVAATLAGAIAFLANVFWLFGGSSDQRNHPLGAIGTLLMLVLAPLAATLLQLAISRAREYEADREGARICGDPAALASALARIEALASHSLLPTAETHPATAPLFIVHPLVGSSLSALFRTHPPTEERIRRLLAMAGGSGTAPTLVGTTRRRGSVPFTGRRA